MAKFTIFKERHVYGANKLSFFENHRVSCEITDFSILLGGTVSSDYYGDTALSLFDFHTGNWWSRTKRFIFGEVRVIAFFNHVDDWLDVRSRDVGVRPVVSLSSILSECKSSWKSWDLIFASYGEYPQYVIREDGASVLENKYLSGTLNKTGKSYTTDSVRCDDMDTFFQPREFDEYEYKGSKFIRFVADSNSDGEVLRNGRKVKKGEVYWVAVQPVEWIVDKEKNIAFSKKILFSGVQYSNKKNYNGTFKKSWLKQYMDKYFSRDIVPSIVTEKEVKLNNYKEAVLGNEGTENQTNSNKNSYDEISDEDRIRLAIENGRPIFLHSDIAERNSSRIKQIDPNCVIIYLNNVTSESLIGKSVDDASTGVMTDVKPLWLKQIEEICEKEPDKNHIVYFDGLTEVVPNIKEMVFDIISNRQVAGKWKLPDNARIVVSGNNKKDNLKEDLSEKFSHICLDTTVESWLKWANENNIHPSICAYIAYKNAEKLSSKVAINKTNIDLKKWELSSIILYKTGKPELLRALVGKETAKDFCQFCQQRAITLEDVINDNYTEQDLNMSTYEKYVTIIGLTQVDEVNFVKVREFVFKIGGEHLCTIFDSIWARNDKKRLEIIKEAGISNNNRGRKV